MRMLDKAMEATEIWAPVLASLIRNHRHDVPQAAYATWLQAASKMTFSDATEHASMLWMLKLLKELAQAWPNTFESAASTSSHGSMDISHHQRCWKVSHVATWQTLLLRCNVQYAGYLAHCHVSDFSLVMAYHLMHYACLQGCWR